MIRFLALFVATVSLTWAIPVDNGVEGDPEIECGPTAIIVNLNTQQPFEGHVYVKGLYSTPGCRNDETGRQVAGITLPFDTCGVSRQRSLNPKGVFVSTTIIISFHPLFLTKVDRAYRIQCFYMEADKTVDTDLEVSMLTTGFQSQAVPMPVCRYEILEGSPTGPIIQYALVGQQVYHKWTCDTETVDTFCMIVHSCFVDDTNGDKVDLIQEDGCANDIYLLNNPEYPSDLMAGVEAHVFKFADRPQLYFQCQITILVKEPGLECPRPSCPTPAGRGGPRPAGPQPPPPPNPWPLSPGSPYAAQGSGIVSHGPGDPAQPFAALPGRPDPQSFHQAGAPFPPAVQGGQITRPVAPAARNRGFNGFDRFGSRRPFDAPALDTVDVVAGPLEQVEELPAVDAPIEFVSQKRRKRQLEFTRNAAGTVDVRFDLNTLDLDQNLEALPPSLTHRSPFSIETSVGRDGVCLSTGLFVSFLTLITAILISIAAFTTCLYLRRRDSNVKEAAVFDAKN